MNDLGPCVLHGQETCLKCMPPDEYYRWQVAHDQRGVLAAYLSAHRTMINGSALCAALAVTERD